MNITVNGKPIICNEQSTITDLLLQLQLSSDTVIIEKNNELIPTKYFSSTILEEKDTLELLHFVGGG